MSRVLLTLCAGSLLGGGFAHAAPPTREQVEERLLTHWSRFGSGTGMFRYSIRRLDAPTSWLDFSGKWAKCGDIWNIQYSGTTENTDAKGAVVRKNETGGYEGNGPYRLLMLSDEEGTRARVDEETPTTLNGFGFPGFFTASPLLVDVRELLRLADEGKRSLSIEEDGHLVLLHLTAPEDALDIRIALDPAMDYSVVYLNASSNSGGQEGTVEMAQDPESGVWFPRYARMIKFKTKPEVDNTYVREFFFEDTRLNQVKNCEDIALRVPANAVFSNGMQGFHHMTTKPITVNEFLKFTEKELTPVGTLAPAPGLPSGRWGTAATAGGALLLVVAAGIFISQKRGAGG